MMIVSFRRRLVLTVIVIAIGLVLGGCAGPNTTTTPIDTESTSPGANEVTDVPEEFPQPDEVQEFDVLTLSAEDVHVQWEVGMSEDEVVDFYSDSLPAAGWEISSQRQGGDSTRFAISGHGWDGAVRVLGGDPVRVLLQLGISEDG